VTPEDRARAREALRRELADDVKQLDAFSRTFRAVAKLVNPSVVHIRMSKTVPLGAAGPFEDDFFRRFFGGPGDEEDGNGGRGGRIVQQAEGSGVIISPDGEILTNNHVVDAADRLEVTLADGRVLDATVVGTDPRTDLAVIRVKGQDLPAAELGDSSQVAVGDWVIAIGNPFGLEHSVTAGIISAVGRTDVTSADRADFIQTDAAINPGNSGGPLVNLQGQVIGINTAIASRTGGFMGIGFAIPIDTAKKVVKQIEDHGYVIRGYLGVKVQALTPDLASRFGVRAGEGVVVPDVVPGGPADAAGIRPGDVILSWNGRPVTRPRDLQDLVTDTAPGTEAQVVLVRGGKSIEKTVTVGEFPGDRGAGEMQRGRRRTQPRENEGRRRGERIGLAVDEVTPAIARQLGLRRAEGVVVVGVDHGSPADLAGLRRGDVIDEVNRKPTPDMDAFDAAMRDARLADGILLRVRREDASVYVMVKQQG
jgi:serine protease Do